MKMSISYLRFWRGVILSLGTMLDGQMPAQTFTTLHSFAVTTQTFDNSDGAGPDTDLILSGRTLYGTTYFGGTNGWGTVFAINTDGTDFTTLHIFTKGTAAASGNVINSDGANPSGGLLLSSNRLYGTAYFGGTNSTGTVFGFNTDGTGFQTLHSFAAPIFSPNSDGANPSADMVLSGNTLYGTCYIGGTNHTGTVFAINTDGTGFRVLYTLPAISAPDYTNSDGAGLFSGLALSGNTLYGTAYNGGTSGKGTVFSLNTDGTGFANLHNFTGGTDGADPIGRLLLSGSTLYGTAQQGGSSGNGTVFSIKTNGTGFTTLHSFTARFDNSNPSLGSTNSDGARPMSGVILSGNTLYGTAYLGGSFGNGTVFSVNVDGTAFTTVYSFTGGADGGYIEGGLVLSGNMLYGTAYFGGSSGSGTIFSISLPPQLTLASSGSNLVLSWATNFTGCTLQATTNLNSRDWTTKLPAPVIVNGQYTVTNGISGQHQFFRLAK
jgi:uncharacterized repeat protein (TIGR03803 family)